MAHDVPRYRVILLGEFGAGKSSLFRRFRDKRFVENPDQHKDIGLDHGARTFRLEGREVELELWDTGGMERVVSMNLSYYRNAHAAIIVYNPYLRVSFDLLSEYILNVAQFTTNCKIFLCGTMLDKTKFNIEEPHVTCVSDDEIQEFENQCIDTICGMYRVSSRTNEGVDHMLYSMAKILSRRRLSIVDAIKLPSYTDIHHEYLRTKPKKSRCCT